MITQEMSTFISLGFVLLVLLIVWAFCKIISPKKEKEDPPGKDGQYRIVTLENGKYAVEEWRLDEWTYPHWLGKNVFDTYKEAYEQMNTFIAEDRRREGYRVSREITRS